MLFFVLAFLSVAAQQPWSRLGLLAGIYAMFAVLIVGGVRAWKQERSLHLNVKVSCAVCDEKIPKRDLDSHLLGMHPQIYRLMRATSWLLGPTIYGFLGYLFVLLGVMVMEVLGEGFWSVVLWLVIGPVFGWMIILVIVGVSIDRRYLRPARAEWRGMHPPVR
jgi:hypothetical protein